MSAFPYKGGELVVCLTTLDPLHEEGDFIRAGDHCVVKDIWPSQRAGSPSTITLFTNPRNDNGWCDIKHFRKVRPDERIGDQHVGRDHTLLIAYRLALSQARTRILLRQSAKAKLTADEWAAVLTTDESRDWAAFRVEFP